MAPIKTYDQSMRKGKSENNFKKIFKKKSEKTNEVIQRKEDIFDQIRTGEMYNQVNITNNFKPYNSSGSIYISKSNCELKSISLITTNSPNEKKVANNKRVKKRKPKKNTAKEDNIVESKKKTVSNKVNKIPQQESPFLNYSNIFPEKIVPSSTPFLPMDNKCSRITSRFHGFSHEESVLVISDIQFSPSKTTNHETPIKRGNFINSRKYARKFKHTLNDNNEIVANSTSLKENKREKSVLNEQESKINSFTVDKSSNNSNIDEINPNPNEKCVEDGIDGQNNFITLRNRRVLIRQLNNSKLSSRFSSQSKEISTESSEITSIDQEIIPEPACKDLVILLEPYKPKINNPEIIVKQPIVLLEKLNNFNVDENNSNNVLNELESTESQNDILLKPQESVIILHESKNSLLLDNNRENQEDETAIKETIDLEEREGNNSVKMPSSPIGDTLNDSDIIESSLMEENYLKSFKIVQELKETSTQNKLNKIPNKETINVDNNSISYILPEDSSDDVEENSFVDENYFKKPALPVKRVQLKPGKSWRRSLNEFKTNGKLSNECRKSCFFIVPSNHLQSVKENTSILEDYANSSCYVTEHKQEDFIEKQLDLEDTFRSLSLNRGTVFIEKPLNTVTAKEIVLRRCGQTEPLPFEECYPPSLLKNCQKIGEGVFGEVFLFKNPNGGTTVMKIVPIEGNQIVNGEKQKKFEEILSEILISMELSNLRYTTTNTAENFTEVKNVKCVYGTYPERLIDLWELYCETKISENDSPEIFTSEQQYIVLELANGGVDLEAFNFNNSLQSHSMFQQVACALAVAENQLNFEHRDLHWGNVLLANTNMKKISFSLDNESIEINTIGVVATIIDFTLSRIEYDGVVIFNNLTLDPDLFLGQGDYQFDIYRLMQEKNGNDWQHFQPYSNVLWLHYILEKAITGLRYKNKKSKVHNEYLEKILYYKENILKCDSAKDFVLTYFI